MAQENLVEKENWVATKKFFSGALLVALLTAVGYLAAFAYQLAYLQYFGVPVFFVDVNIGLILLTASGGLIWVLGLIAYFDSLSSWKPQNNFLKFLKNLTILLTIEIVGLFPVIVLCLTTSIGILLLPIFLIGQIVYLYKNPGSNKDTVKKKSKSVLMSRIEEVYGSFPIGFVATLIIFVIFSGIMGFDIARIKSDYLVSNTDPALIIISTYNGNFIGLTFDPNTHSFDKNITLITQDKVSSNGIVFKSKEIGPLRPAK